MRNGVRLWRDGCFGLGALLLAAALMGCSVSEPDELAGTELTAANPASPFELHNQFGQAVSLSDYQGSLLVLTFLYTNCPDVCPLTTSQLRDTHAALGDDADDVRFAAVSVDPERDSVDAALEYSQRWDMADKWDFLVGEREQLSGVWKAYYLDPFVDHDEDKRRTHITQTGDDHDRGASANAPRQDLGEYLVSHSAPVYLIDREGRMRVVFTSPLEPEAIAHDIRLLLK